jgi:hypothetical protein
LCAARQETRYSGVGTSLPPADGPTPATSPRLIEVPIMRARSCLIFILIALLSAAAGAATFETQGAVVPAAAVEPKTADAQAFLKTLQEAVAIDNRLRVASLIEYPLQAWAGGETVTVRNASDFQARYRKIFDDSLRTALAAIQGDAIALDAQGVVIDKGRIVCRSVGNKGKLKIVAINEPGK